MHDPARTPDGEVCTLDDDGYILVLRRIGGRPRPRRAEQLRVAPRRRVVVGRRQPLLAARSPSAVRNSFSPGVPKLAAFSFRRTTRSLNPCECRQRLSYGIRVKGFVWARCRAYGSNASGGLGRKCHTWRFDRRYALARQQSKSGCGPWRTEHGMGIGERRRTARDSLWHRVILDGNVRRYSRWPRHSLPARW